MFRIILYNESETKKFTTMKTFKLNATYRMNWIGDSSLVTLFKVTKITPSFLTVKNISTGETHRAKIKNYDGEQYVLPLGSYSMAPSLRAGKLA